MVLRAATSSVALALALVAGCAGPQPAGEQRAAADMLRGGQLYRTHCIACHTAQVHWREKSLVHSWEDLLY